MDSIGELNYLSEKDWSRLYSIEKPRRDQLIILLLYETGCTVNELVHIAFSDVNFSRNTIGIRGKASRNGEPRTAYVSSSLLSIIREEKKDNDGEYVLGTRQSSMMTTKRVCQIVKNYCERIGVKDASPQILRYTHIVHAYEKDIPIDAIQKQVGLKRSRAIEIFSLLKGKANMSAYRRFMEK